MNNNNNNIYIDYVNTVRLIVKLHSIFLLPKHARNSFAFRNSHENSQREPCRFHRESLTSLIFLAHLPPKSENLQRINSNTGHVGAPSIPWVRGAN